jgi:hypothetical protein
MSVTYTATLTLREEAVLFVSGLLHAERQRRGTRDGTRSLGCFKQAVLGWFLDEPLRGMAHSDSCARANRSSVSASWSGR